MKKHYGLTLAALAVIASFNTANADDLSDKTAAFMLPNIQAPMSSSSERETGQFLKLSALLRDTDSVSVTELSASSTATMARDAKYKDAVVFTGKMPSLIRSAESTDMILVLREDKSFLAMYPDQHKIIYSTPAGEQTQITFKKPIFSQEDTLIPAVQGDALQTLARDGSSLYKGDIDKDGYIVIDVLAGFSKAAAKTIIDPEAFALAQLTTVNQALKNSRIEKIRVRLVGTQIIDQDYSITGGTLSKINKLFSQGMSEYGPDLIAAFFEGNNDDTAIGIAYVNGRYNINALYASTSLRHELSHNIGGKHCWSGSGDHHGWDNDKTQTIQCGNDIGYFSNPDLQDNYGLPIGDKNKANMARVWRDNAAKISGYNPAVIPFDHEKSLMLAEQSVKLNKSNNYLHRIEFNVPANTHRLAVSAVPGPQHEETGQFSLYLSKGSWPSANDYDYKGREAWNTSLGVTKPAAGKWHLAVASKNTAIDDIIVRVQAFTESGEEIVPDEVSTSLQNAGAETGNLSGWKLTQGQFRVVTSQDGILPAKGKYFFTARINNSAANNATHDQISQSIALDKSLVSQGNHVAKLQFKSNGFGDGDYGTVYLIAKNAKGATLKTAQVNTQGLKKRWLNNTVSVDLPAQATLLEVQVQATKKMGVTSDVHFDDFILNIEKKSNEGDDNQPENHAPTAIAKATPAEITGSGSVILSAVGSSDPDGDSLKYQWRQISSGPKITLKNAQTIQATASFPAVEKQTTYRFNVTVTDTHGASATSETQVTQKPAATADNPQWISSKTYPKPCVKVSYQGKQWMNGWWTVGNVPGVGGTWGVWREIGDKNMHASCK